MLIRFKAIYFFDPKKDIKFLKIQQTFFKVNYILLTTGLIGKIIIKGFSDMQYFFILIPLLMR